MFGAEYSERDVLAKKTAAGTVSAQRPQPACETFSARRTPPETDPGVPRSQTKRTVNDVSLDVNRRSDCFREHASMHTDETHAARLDAVVLVRPTAQANASS